LRSFRQEEKGRLEANVHLQLEDENHLRVSLEDLVKGDEAGTMSGSIQHGHFVKRFRPQSALGPSSFPQELGGPLPAAGPLAAFLHRRIFTAAT